MICNECDKDKNINTNDIKEEWFYMQFIKCITSNVWYSIEFIKL